MKKLYNEKPLLFSLICIGIYVVSLSAADALSEYIGVQKVITAPLCILLSAAIILFLLKEKIAGECGLARPDGKHSHYLFYLPLAVVISTNLWFGVTMNFTLAETVLYVISMLFVGFLEEIIFRGFLFRAILRDNPGLAITVSSLTFGFGHVVNLLNGADPLPTFLQIIYATAGGFMFTVIFYRSGSLIPCIAAHSLLNMLSAFCPETNTLQQIVSCSVLTAVSVSYGILILKLAPRRDEN